MSFYIYKNYELIENKNKYTLLKHNEITKKDYYKNKNNRRVKNIYYIMKNIDKLKDGRIKKYRIYNQLELEILCDYLDKSGILYTIYVKNSFEKIYKNTKDQIKYYMENIYDIEHNYVYRNYELYIKVYKGYINLLENYDLSQQFKITMHDKIPI